MNQWSESVRTETARSLENKDFGAREGKVSFKHISSKYGHMLLEDALNGEWIIHLKDGGVEKFSSIDELISSGWVLD